MEPHFSNILVVRTDRIGDVVLTTPALQVLRPALPSARITLLVTPTTRELVDGLALVDEVLVDDRRGRHRGPAGFLRLAAEIRRRRFDLALVFHTKRRTNLLCALAGIPVRAGFRDDKFGFLLNRPVPDVRPRGARHESELCLDVLAAVGLRTKECPLPTIAFQPAAEAWADSELAQINPDGRKLIAVHPDASSPSKRWPVKKFAQVCDAAARRHQARCVIVGAAASRTLARRLRDLCEEPVADLTGRTGVAQLASVLKRCDLLISNDSGPVHVADAGGIPVVSIFTRNQPGINPERWRPRGPRTRVVTTPFSGAMSFRKGDEGSEAYLGLVPTEEVLAAVDALIKLC